MNERMVCQKCRKLAPVYTEPDPLRTDPIYVDEREKEEPISDATIIDDDHIDLDVDSAIN